MKILSLTVAIMSIFVTYSSASVIDKVETINVIENEKSVILNLHTMVADVNHVRIIDAEGSSIYDATVDATKELIKYNLEALKNGKYQFIVSGDNFIESYDLIITSSDAKLINKEAYFKPMIREHNGQITVNALNLGKDDFGMAIYNEDGELVYEEDLNIEGTVKRVYSFDKLPTGNYTTAVTSKFFTTSLETEL